MSQVLRALRRIAYDAKSFMPLLPRRPLEFYDRLAMSVANRREELREKPVYQAETWETVLDALNLQLNCSLLEIGDEPALREIEERVRSQMEALPDDAPFTRKHNAGFALARACYLLCRALQPNTVVETGVAYGVNSAFMLKALEVNGRGRLHSVDLAPSIADDAGRYVGHLIPEVLRHRWQLHAGISARILPGLMPKLGRIGLFVHDSLHTYANMLWEFRAATPYFAANAALISDDVGGNTAFLDWVAETRPVYWAVVPQEDKGAYFGVSLLGTSQHRL